jgi:hypothetical protein
MKLVQQKRSISSDDDDFMPQKTPKPKSPVTKKKSNGKENLVNGSTAVKPKPAVIDLTLDDDEGSPR